MKSPLYKSQISGQNLVKFTQKISLAMGLGERCPKGELWGHLSSPN
jgi:hypothetical protein